jgi:serpin B
MRNKKIICIIFAVTLIVSANGIIGQPENIDDKTNGIFDNDNNVDIKKGTVRLLEGSDEDVYIIEMENNGISIMGFKFLTFESIIPVNCQDELEDYLGEKVNFTLDYSHLSLFEKISTIFNCIIDKIKGDIPSVEISNLELSEEDDIPSIDMGLNILKIEEKTDGLVIGIFSLENNNDNPVDVPPLKSKLKLIIKNTTDSREEIIKNVTFPGDYPSTITIPAHREEVIIVDINPDRDLILGGYTIKAEYSCEASEYYPDIELTSDSLFILDGDSPFEVDETSVNAMNEYSMNLYDQFILDQSQQGKNILFAPTMSYWNLAMLYLGARGDTADEIATVLGIDDMDEQIFLEAMRKLCSESINNDDDVYTLLNDNSLWVNEKFQADISQTFKTDLENYFNSDDYYLDVSTSSARENSADIMNAYIEEKTKGLIKNMVKPEDFEPEYYPDREVEWFNMLVSTIYANLTWENEFDERENTNGIFSHLDGSQSSVTYMNFEGFYRDMNYAETDNLQVLDLPYKGGEVSMLFILPKDGYDLYSISENITVDDLSNWRDMFSQMNWADAELHMSIPKFEIETPRYELKQYLSNMGMPTAFDEYSADFFDMVTQDAQQRFEAENKNICVKDVYHKAYMKVYEKGTIAGGTQGPTQTIEFEADHPFVLLMQHKSTGNILFMGNVCDPSQ